MILLLFFSELSLFMRTETLDHLEVDVSRGEKLRIHFDVTFPQSVDRYTDRDSAALLAAAATGWR